MKTVAIILSLEDDKFNEMEKVLLNNGHQKEEMSEDDWTRYVIENYQAAEEYLDCHNGNLEEAYKDMIYDF